MSIQAQLAELDRLLAQATRKPVSTSRPLDPRLHSYQRRAVEHLWQGSAGLLVDMGLGKTAAALQALTPDRLPALVVAPKRVAKEVWPTESAKWRPDLSVAVAAGTKPKRQAALDQPADLTVIGVDNLKDINPDHRYRTIILDELSGYKNRGSVRWKLARKLCARADQTWGLTGTPSPNGLLDLWSQIYLLDGGQRLGRTLTQYRNRYFQVGRQLPSGTIIEWKLRPGSQQAIEAKLADLCLSMQAKDYLDLPPSTINPVTVPLDAKASRVYDEMVKTLVTQVDSEVHTSANAAVLTGKLSQITAGFLYADGDTSTHTELHTAKTDAVCEVVAGTGSPVLVFYRYIAERDALLAALPQARTIDDPGVIEDWNAGEVPVLLAHPASAGHGLNLQAGGHTIVWSTLPWSLELWQQSNARLDRQGQQHPVMIHVLTCPGTVDEAILARLRDKTTIQDALMRALGLTA